MISPTIISLLKKLHSRVAWGLHYCCLDLFQLLLIESEITSTNLVNQLSCHYPQRWAFLIALPSQWPAAAQLSTATEWLAGGKLSGDRRRSGDTCSPDAEMIVFEEQHNTYSLPHLATPSKCYCMLLNHSPVLSVCACVHSWKYVPSLLQLHYVRLNWIVLQYVFDDLIRWNHRSDICCFVLTLPCCLLCLLAAALLLYLLLGWRFDCLHLVTDLLKLLAFQNKMWHPWGGMAALIVFCVNSVLRGHFSWIYLFFI